MSANKFCFVSELPAVSLAAAVRPDFMRSSARLAFLLHLRVRSYAHVPAPHMPRLYRARVLRDVLIKQQLCLAAGLRDEETERDRSGEMEKERGSKRGSVAEGGPLCV